MNAFILPFEDKYLGDAFGVMTPLRKKLGLGAHRGTDYNKLKAGTPIPAIANGKVFASYFSPGLGNVLILEVLAPWKDNPARKLYFGYCHLQTLSPLKKGTRVKTGDIIGAIGNTGKFSSGNHLHLTLGLTPESVSYGFVTDAHAYLVRRGAKAIIKTKPKAKK